MGQQIFTTTGANTWNWPAGVTSVTIEAIGGGGAGATTDLGSAIGDVTRSGGSGGTGSSTVTGAGGGAAVNYTHSGLPTTLQTHYYRVKTVTGSISSDYSTTVSKVMKKVNFFGTSEPPMS